jgi:hypothetical protein
MKIPLNIFNSLHLSPNLFSTNPYISKKLSKK